MPPAGFEPAHPAPEAGALSPELRGRRQAVYQPASTPDQPSPVHAPSLRASNVLATSSKGAGRYRPRTGRGGDRTPGERLRFPVTSMSSAPPIVSRIAVQTAQADSASRSHRPETTTTKETFSIRDVVTSHCFPTGHASRNIPSCDQFGKAPSASVWSPSRWACIRQRRTGPPSSKCCAKPTAARSSTSE